MLERGSFRNLSSTMETQLTFDSKAKQLNLAFKERFVTDSNFQLKITGGINTRTGKPQVSH